MKREKDLQEALDALTALPKFVNLGQGDVETPPEIPHSVPSLSAEENKLTEALHVNCGSWGWDRMSPQPRSAGRATCPLTATSRCQPNGDLRPFANRSSSQRTDLTRDALPRTLLANSTQGFVAFKIPGQENAGECRRYGSTVRRHFSNADDSGRSDSRSGLNLRPAYGAPRVATEIEISIPTVLGAGAATTLAAIMAQGRDKRNWPVIVRGQCAVEDSTGQGHSLQRESDTLSLTTQPDLFKAQMNTTHTSKLAQRQSGRLPKCTYPCG
ncbi:hypothetical protein SKAU_G00140480 [Synaphobranchus kaupii]|uniref:Uncharacterized protein n=1 Tax=Synaphobranchus kaupii TaxID=118154 RepID=A0A9Q1FT51_SYNKA|nr:hypothetical protein SKAU_G00140480 [Synaphobranchus kaupii]